MGRPSEIGERLTAFVNFPSQYTQNLLLSALTSTLPALSITTQPAEDSQTCPQLQWADYDLLFIDDIMSHPDDQMISSYVYRKTLIRKHMLHNAVQEYLAKQQHRGIPSLLSTSIPRGWVIDIQFADELDELMMDELYDLKDDLDANLEIEDVAKRRWFILKPGMSDKAQGIRMFATEDELVSIFEGFEPESEDEDDEEEQDDEEAEAQEGGLSKEDRERIEQLAIQDFPDDEPFEPELESEPKETGTGIQTSQLRHFVIQEYVPRPMLVDPKEYMGRTGTQLEGHKFHLRAYVLMSGTYKLYLAQTMLALFSSRKFDFTVPEGRDEEEMDLTAHLTNTCLQSEAAGSSGPPEELVKLYWELAGQTALDENGKAQGTIDQAWLDSTFEQVGQVVAETVTAAVNCGSFGLQLLPNAFEIFGVDLLLSFPAQAEPIGPALPKPIVTLLEFNASPDYFQSGNRLRSELAEMFRGVVQMVVAPFFGLTTIQDQDTAEDDTPSDTNTTGAWKLIGEEKTRGDW